MKTRIKQTTKTYDGTDITEYTAEVHVWQDSLSWYPARLKLDWMGYTDSMSREAFANEFGPHGSLGRAQKIIDRLLEIVENDKQEAARQKAVEKSKKVKYIKYP